MSSRSHQLFARSARDGAWCAVIRAAIAIITISISSCAPTGQGGARGGNRAGSGVADRSSSVVGQGVEVTLWTLSDVPSDIASGSEGQRLPNQAPQSSLQDALDALVARSAAGVPSAPQASLDAWQGSGLRVTRLRTADLAALEKAVGASAAQRSSWVAFGLHPTEVLRGSRADDRTILATDTGPLALNGGTMKLALRSWPVAALPPSISADAAVQVELLLSVLPKPRAGRSSLLVDGAAITRGAADSTDDRDSQSTPNRAVVLGLLPRLTLPVLVTSGDCLLIEPVDASSGQAGVQSGQSSESTGKGPPVPALPSVGEALLSDVFAFPRAGVRTVAIIRPVVDAKHRDAGSSRE